MFFICDYTSSCECMNGNYLSKVFIHYKLTLIFTLPGNTCSMLPVWLRQRSRHGYDQEISSLHWFVCECVFGVGVSVIIYGNTWLNTCLSCEYCLLGNGGSEAWCFSDWRWWALSGKTSFKVSFKKKGRWVLWCFISIIYLECKEFTVSSEHLKPLIIVPCDINRKYLR